MSPQEVAELEQLLPPDCVFTDESVRQLFSGDKWLQGPLPEVVVRPRSTVEVAALLKYANERVIPVTTRGGGWGYVGGAVTNRGGILLSLDRMNAIREISETDFVAVVESGAITAQLHQKARDLGLLYPPDPASSGHSTLGGNIAANAGGPRCLKYGVTRNYVLGLEVVLADGTILNLGGRTHKNVTGFDLLGLFVGSEGMLGVVTSATLKLLPYSQARSGIAAVFADIETAAHAVQEVFRAGILPSACEIADEFTFRTFQRAIGATETPGAHVLIEVDGPFTGARDEIREIKAVLVDAGAYEITAAHDEETVEELWAVRRQFSEALTASRNIRLNEDVVVPRGKLLDLVSFGRELSAKYGVDIACFGHAGDGNIHVNLMLDETSQAEAVLDELFAQVLAWGGAITGEHGIGLAKAKWWPQAVSPEVRQANAALKNHFDPNGILNPGKWL
ncbi:FAD-binding protein [bacterium]|nr:MAG: FAD-binding protein [bacterium]